MLGSIETHFMQVGRGGFHFINLGRSEGIIGSFIPVWVAVDGVVVQAIGRNFLLPIETGWCCDPLHGQLPPEEWNPPRLPNPPRDMLMVRMERLPWRPLKTVPERKLGP